METDLTFLEDVILESLDVEVLGSKIKFKIEDKYYFLYCYTCDGFTDYVVRNLNGEEIEHQTEEHKIIQDSLKKLLSF